MGRCAARCKCGLGKNERSYRSAGSAVQFEPCSSCPRFKTCGCRKTPAIRVVDLARKLPLLRLDRSAVKFPARFRFGWECQHSQLERFPIEDEAPQRAVTCCVWT